MNLCKITIIRIRKVEDNFKSLLKRPRVLINLLKTCNNLERRVRLPAEIRDVCNILPSTCPNGKIVIPSNLASGKYNSAALHRITFFIPRINT